MTLWLMIMHHHTKFNYRRYCPDEVTGILNLFCDLDLDHYRAIRSFHKTIQLLMMCHQTKFSHKRIRRPGDILERHILIMRSFTVTLTLKKANQSFGKAIWLIMMHQYTKFGSKRISDSKDITWINIHQHFEILL